MKNKTGNKTQNSNKQIPKLEDFYDELDPRGCSTSEYNNYIIALNKWKNDNNINNNFIKDKYVIIDFRNMDYMKNEIGEINYYDTLEEASLVCGMYEFENAWICKLIYNHIENK